MAPRPRDPSLWLPARVKRPSFCNPRALWEDELPKLTDEQHSAIREAFGQRARRRFGDARVDEWIRVEAVNAIAGVAWLRHTRSGIAVHEAREHIAEVADAAATLLHTLQRLERSRALHEFESHAGTLAAVVSVRLSDPAHRPNVSADTVKGASALLSHITRRLPLRPPWPSKMLPELWDNLEALRIQASYTLHMLRPDKTRQVRARERRVLVSELADHWEHHFGQPPSAGKGAMFVRVVRAVAACADLRDGDRKGLPDNRSIAAALRARKGSMVTLTDSGWHVSTAHGWEPLPHDQVDSKLEEFGFHRLPENRDDGT